MQGFIQPGCTLLTLHFTMPKARAQRGDEGAGTAEAGSDAASGAALPDLSEEEVASLLSINNPGLLNLLSHLAATPRAISSAGPPPGDGAEAQAQAPVEEAVLVALLGQVRLMSADALHMAGHAHGRSCTWQVMHMAGARRQACHDAERR